jgi:7-cyano-7-deazaguanine synthase
MDDPIEPFTDQLLQDEELKAKAPTAIVLHSGGIDSTTCLYMAAEAFGRKNIAGLSVHYGQRHEKEIYQAQVICQQLGVEHHVVKMTDLPMSMLTNPDVQVPSASYEELGKGVSPTYVPFRNGNLLSHVTSIAQAQRASAIYFGAHAEDAHNWAYPDCTPEFIGAMANAIYIGTYHQVRLITPLEWLTKHEIIRAGNALGIPWSLTWSCYKGEELHCGTCPTCRARQDGFKGADTFDPTSYQTSPDNDIPF